MEKNELVGSIEALYSKYSNDPYMSVRFQNFVCNQLPNVLENMANQHQQRVIRTEELSAEFDTFVSTFMNKNQYFYISSTEKFFYYDGVHYRPYSEDGILHHILTSITNGRSLMSWKYKTKMSIMKRIKDNSLFTSIPESDTIQNVIMSLYPTFFSSKTAAKYFLTILGDNILKKKTDTIHLLPPYAKAFIRELNNFCQFNVGSNLFHSLKLKYHEHDYSNCRLVHINETIKYENIWRNMIDEIGIDIICVAIHYSLRYENSDDFVVDSQDDNLKSHVFYLRDRTASDLVSGFIHNYITFDKTTSTITWRNLQYLWKHFLNSKKLPMIIFQTNLKQELTKALAANYMEDSDTFNGVFSKFMPEIQNFTQFWDENMVEDANEHGLELEEIRRMFYKWSNTSITDEQIIDLIQYFYPSVIIENDKYIQEIRCSLWDKQKSIKNVFDEIKSEWPDKDNDLSVYDAYLYYCKRYKKRKVNGASDLGLIVHKSYFEDYVIRHFSNYIVAPGILSKTWFFKTI
jgi:hypothetical protein